MTDDDLSNAAIDKKLRAQISSLIDETAEINRRPWWHPLVISIAYVVAVITVTKLFL